MYFFHSFVLFLALAIVTESKNASCDLPSVVVPSIVNIEQHARSCPLNQGLPTYKQLVDIKQALCDLPSFDDWGIINGADCSIWGTGYGCPIKHEQEPDAGDIFCVPCKNASCDLPSVVEPSIVNIIDGVNCPLGQGLPTFNLLDDIKQALCDLPSFDDWAIINGANCSMRGTGYGCQITQRQDPHAGETFCVPCKNAPCDLPSVVEPSIVNIIDGVNCPLGQGLPTFNLLDDIKQALCDLPSVDDWAIINGADCKILGTGYGCQILHGQDPDARETFCVPCKNASCDLPSAVVPSIVNIEHARSCPLNQGLPTYKQLVDIRAALCNLSSFDDWGIINGADCKILGTGFGCQILHGQDPMAEEIFCVPCKDASCDLPSVVVPSIVNIELARSCPLNQGLPTYKQLVDIKLALCDLPSFDDWGIINGADCSIRGTGYGCQILHEQNPVAEEIFCVPCKNASCDLPSVVVPSIVNIEQHARSCPLNQGLPTYKQLVDIKQALCDLPSFDDWGIINGADCSIWGTGYGCPIKHEQEPDAGDIFCVPCKNASLWLPS